MHKFVFHNDSLLPLEQVRLSPGQAGLLNGWGVFTTIRIYEGQPFAFERHWKRLTTDADRIDLPIEQSEAQVRERLMELLRANEVVDGCARIYLVYNKIGMWSGREQMPTTDLIMYTTDLPLRVGPVKLGVQLNGRHAAHPLAGTKVTSWLQNVWLVEQAHARGFEDMVLVNERDEVAECTAGNLFCVKAGSVFTPPLRHRLPGRRIATDSSGRGGANRHFHWRTRDGAGRISRLRRDIHHLDDETGAASQSHREARVYA